MGYISPPHQSTEISGLLYCSLKKGDVSERHFHHSNRSVTQMNYDAQFLSMT